MGAKLGHPVSEATRAKIRAANLGRKWGPRPEATRAKQSAALKGRVKGPLPEAQRAKISAALSGRPRSEATKAKLRIANAGRPPVPAAYAHWVGVHKRGAESNSWKGGVVTLGQYRAIYAPDHPRAGKTGYVYEHILVAEQARGRPVEPGEVVHHLDHNKLNNVPDNLVVVASHSEHIRIYHRHGRPRHSSISPRVS